MANKETLNIFKWISVVVIIGYSWTPITKIFYNEVATLNDQINKYTRTKEHLETVHEYKEDFDDLDPIRDLLGEEGFAKARIAEVPTDGKGFRVKRKDMLTMDKYEEKYKLKETKLLQKALTEALEYFQKAIIQWSLCMILHMTIVTIILLEFFKIGNVFVKNAIFLIALVLFHFYFGQESKTLRVDIPREVAYIKEDDMMVIYPPFDSKTMNAVLFSYGLIWFCFVSEATLNSIIL